MDSLLINQNRIVHDFICEQFGIEYWEEFQRGIFLSNELKEIYVKSRQVGLSFAFAADALARSLLFGEKFLITSYTKDEASEKIEYARSFLRKVKIKVPSIVHDATFTLAFENGGEVKSVPIRSIRGRSKNIYADEFEYYKNATEVYRAVLPSVVRQDGTIRRLKIWSTPLSSSGLMATILRKNEEKPLYKVHYIPWWHSFALCKDVKRAKQEAPYMSTHDRVYKFGTEYLIQQFEDPGMDIDSFRLEYECQFLDSADIDFITLESLLQVVNEDLPYRSFTTDSFFIEYGGKVRIGMDVGRKNNATEIMVLNEENVLLYNISLRNVSFEVQKNVAFKLFEMLEVERFYIDAVGIGMNLAEDLARKFGTRVVSVTFTAKEKDRIASNLKRMIETKKIELPYDKKLIAQILSVKREMNSERVVPKYYVQSLDEKDNADKFWALAMAVGEQNTEKAYAVVPNPYIRYRKVSDNVWARVLR